MAVERLGLHLQVMGMPLHGGSTNSEDESNVKNFFDDGKRLRETALSTDMLSAMKWAKG